jgi:tetratricopeptide (TPR) repeat protein
LIQVSPEQHLWAKRYECDLADFLTLQGQIAQAIAAAVQLAVSPGELCRLTRRRPVDPEAHLAYLRGRHHMSRWSRESLEKALEYFELALKKDPSHALSYAQAADCYAHLGFWGHHPFPDAYKRAKESAMKALALDDTLSTAHWAFGWSTSGDRLGFGHLRDRNPARHPTEPERRACARCKFHFYHRHNRQPSTS